VKKPPEGKRHVPSRKGRSSLKGRKVPFVGREPLKKNAHDGRKVGLSGGGTLPKYLYNQASLKGRGGCCGGGRE